MILVCWEESYKEIAETKSQRLITKFLFKTSESKDIKDVNFIEDTHGDIAIKFFQRPE